MSYYRETRNRRTKTTIIVSRAADLEVDPDGGPWVTICDDHGSICNHETLAMARAHATDPFWCEDCLRIMEEQEHRG